MLELDLVPARCGNSRSPMGIYGAYQDVSGTTSASLLDGARAQDPVSWSRLVDLYGPLVYRWCRLASIGPDDAADVTQEVLGAVAANLGSFHKDRPGESFRAWLWGITRRKTADFFRRRKKDPQAAGGTDAHHLLAQVPDPGGRDFDADEDRVGSQGLAHRAAKILRAGVQDQTWKAFWRVAVDGRPVAEVAEELGMSVKAVYQAKYRVLQRANEELSGLIEYKQ